MFPLVPRNLPTLDLKPFTSGGVSYNAIYAALYLTRQLRYTTPKHFKELDKIYPQWEFPKFCTAPKMKKIAALGYLKETEDGSGIYTARDMCKPILEKAGFYIKLLPEEGKGIGEINALNNVDAFIQAHAMPHFFTLLFPNQGYIEPDAMVVQKDGQKIKLTCLEIEASKKRPDWLEDKRENYFKLAKDYAFYEYWKDTAQKLHLKIPTPEEFKFSVTIVGAVKKDFGVGFNFIEHL